MTDPVPTIAALLQMTDDEFKALLFADASGGQGPPPAPALERHGRDEPSVHIGGQGPPIQDDHQAAHVADMDGRQGRPDIGSQSVEATGPSPSESIPDSRQGRPASDDHAGAAMGDPQQDSDAGGRLGRPEGTPVDGPAEAAAGQGPEETDGVGDVGDQDEGSDVMEGKGDEHGPTAPVSAGGAAAPEVATPAVVVVDASFAALAGPDAVPSVVRGAARRLWATQVVLPALQADAPVGDAETALTAPPASDATETIATPDGIPDDEAPVQDDTVGRQGRPDVPPSVDGQGPATATEPDPRQGRDAGMDDRQGRPTDGDHPTAGPAEDGDVVDRPAGPAMDAHADVSVAIEPAGPAEDADPAAGPLAAEESRPAGPAGPADPTEAVDGAVAEPKEEMDPKSARQLRLLREAADEIVEELSATAREAKRVAEEHAKLNREQHGCLKLATWLTQSSGSDPYIYIGSFRKHAVKHGVVVTPAIEADFTLIREPPREQDGTADADVDAAQREVDDSERALATALAEVEAAMAAESAQRIDRATDERILVEIDAADRAALADALASAGRPVPACLTSGGPIPDDAAADIRHELLVAERELMRQIAAEEAGDGAVDPRVLAAIDGVRRLVDRVAADAESRLGDIDAILVRDGWSPIGAWIRDEAERIAGEPSFPDPDALTLDEAESAPDRFAAETRPSKPMWRRRMTHRAQRWTANHPMQQRVNEHLRAEETES